MSSLSLLRFLGCFVCLASVSVVACAQRLNSSSSAKVAKATEEQSASSTEKQSRQEPRDSTNQARQVDDGCQVDN